MRIPQQIVLSLILTAIISFILPVTLVGVSLGFVTLIGLIPGLMEIGYQLNTAFIEFLKIFGNGQPIIGIMILGLTGSFTGILFDIFNNYRYQSWR